MKAKALTKKEIAAFMPARAREGIRGVRPKPGPLALMAANIGMSIRGLGALVGVAPNTITCWTRTGVPTKYGRRLTDLMARYRGVKGRVPWGRLIAQALRKA